MTCQFNRPDADPVRAVTDLMAAAPAGICQLGDGLSRCLGTDVRIAARRLPDACASLWTGLEQADQIDFNANWPMPEVERIAHTAGHLLLGHCGQVRDGGRFACVVEDGPAVREHVRAVLPDREPQTPQRIFSDLEERQAETFAELLLTRFGHARRAAAFACIG
jgi:hypothetical protein